MKRFILAAALLAFAGPAMAQMGLTPQWNAAKAEADYQRDNPGLAAAIRRSQNAPWVDRDFHGYRTDHADSGRARPSPSK